MESRLVVQKYGGTSVATTEKIRIIARRLAEARKRGDSLVVVVSAMDQGTDQLMSLARESSPDPDRRELDLLLSTGEQVTMSLLAMAVRAQGAEAISLTGAQCGIVTNGAHGNARILRVDPRRLRHELDRGAVVIVAGFQGMAENGEVTTLGRGGSDTTAAALAAALDADACQIYTDVDSVYSADPRQVEAARAIPTLEAETMQELAWHGARVLKAEAVEFARTNGVDLEVRHAFGDGGGTLVSSTRDGAVEGLPYTPHRPPVAGVAGRKDLVRLTCHRADLADDAIDELFARIADYDLVFARRCTLGGDLDLLLSTQEIPDVAKLCHELEGRFGGAIRIRAALGSASLVGFGLGSRPRAFWDALNVLRRDGLEIQQSFSGRESFRFLLPVESIDTAVRLLHRVFVEASVDDGSADCPDRHPRGVGRGKSEVAKVQFETFETLESAVRSYCRAFPAIFEKASGAILTDQEGRHYIDFFAGAGTLNYGHNDAGIKRAVLDYLAEDNIIHSLDMATRAKGEFLERFHEVILAPRGLDYRVQFPGPTGTNAVEASLKLARKVTGRPGVVYMSGAFHGMTLGSMSVAGDSRRRADAGIPLDHTRQLAFESDDPSALDGFETEMASTPKGDLPAAVILETVQAEGGVRAASFPWLRRLRQICDRFDVLMIVDDIQVGCGRTGPFFSFEGAEVVPDMVCLSKSLGGFGLPFSLVLLRPELDSWRPGEHNGTFRGQNLSFVAATAALDYWRDDTLERRVAVLEGVVRRSLEGLAERHPELGGRAVGRGLIQGLLFADPSTAGRVSRAAFERGLVIECAGPADEVLKLLPPLTIDEATLEQGLEILAASLGAVASETSVSEMGSSKAAEEQEMAGSAPELVA